MARSLIGTKFTFECSFNCKHVFEKTIEESDFATEDDYVDTILNSPDTVIEEGTPAFKEKIQKYLDLEEYFIECPNCANLEQVGTTYPQYFKTLNIKKYFNVPHDLYIKKSDIERMEKGHSALGYTKPPSCIYELVKKESFQPITEQCVVDNNTFDVVFIGK